MTQLHKRWKLIFMVLIVSLALVSGCSGKSTSPGNSPPDSPGADPGADAPGKPGPVYDGGKFVMKNPLEGSECVSFCENNCDTAVKCKLGDNLISNEECQNSCKAACKEKKISKKYLNCVKFADCDAFRKCFMDVDQSEEKIDLNEPDAVKASGPPPDAPGEVTPGAPIAEQDKPDAAPSANTPQTAATSEEKPAEAPAAPAPPPSGDGEPGEPVPSAPATPPAGGAEPSANQ